MADVELILKISNIGGITAYKFRYDDHDINVTNQNGKFVVDSETSGRLKWWMLGSPGGSMKVEVFKGEALVRARQNSKIPNSKPAGFDWMMISVGDQS